MANAIIYFNSKVLRNLLVSFEQQGNEDGLKAVKNASPVAWDNINLRGTYTFEVSEELPRMEDLMLPIEGYRPITKK